MNKMLRIRIKIIIIGVEYKKWWELNKGKNFSERIVKEREKERKKKIEEYMEKLVSQARRVAKNQIWNHVIFHYDITEGWLLEKEDLHLEK